MKSAFLLRQDATGSALGRTLTVDLRGQDLEIALSCDNGPRIALALSRDERVALLGYLATLPADVMEVVTNEMAPEGAMPLLTVVERVASMVAEHPDTAEDLRRVSAGGTIPDAAAGRLARAGFLFWTKGLGLVARQALTAAGTEALSLLDKGQPAARVQTWDGLSPVDRLEAIRDLYPKAVEALAAISLRDTVGLVIGRALAGAGLASIYPDSDGDEVCFITPDGLEALLGVQAKAEPVQ